MMRNHPLVLAGLAALAVLLVAAGGCTQPAGYSRFSKTNMPFIDINVPLSTPRAAAVATRTPATGKNAWAAQGSHEWRYIVVHHSATESGNAAEFDRMHRNRGWDELGYHFVITNGNGGPDGAVEVGPRWTKQKHGAHTGGTPDNEYNEHGIGICLVGDFTNHNPTPAQLRALRELTTYLMEQYHIPPGRIIAHRDAPNQKTECCGRTFYAYLHGAFRSDLQRLATR